MESRERSAGGDIHNHFARRSGSEMAVGRRFDDRTFGCRHGRRRTAAGKKDGRREEKGRGAEKERTGQVEEKRKGIARFYDRTGEQRRCNWCCASQHIYRHSSPVERDVY